MIVELRHRHYGVHELVESVTIEGSFEDYCTDIGKGNYKIQEEKLIAALPEKFLPCSPKNILLTVSDECGGTGQIHLAHFHPWAKYFDAYVISLMMPPKPWCIQQTVCKEDVGKNTFTCMAHMAEGRAFQCPYKNNEDREKGYKYPCSDYAAISN